MAHSFGRFCGDTPPNNGTIISTNNILYLWFRSDYSVANKGFELNWTSIEPGKRQYIFVSKKITKKIILLQFVVTLLQLHLMEVLSRQDRLEIIHPTGKNKSVSAKNI